MTTKNCSTSTNYSREERRDPVRGLTFRYVTLHTRYTAIGTGEVWFGHLIARRTAHPLQERRPSVWPMLIVVKTEHQQVYLYAKPTTRTADEISGLPLAIYTSVSIPSLSDGYQSTTAPGCFYQQAQGSNVS